MTKLLAKIMAQILSILALSARTMKETRISQSIQSICSFFIDCGARKVYEEASGKDGGGGWASKIGYADKRGESDDCGENLGSNTPY